MHSKLVATALILSVAIVSAHAGQPKTPPKNPNAPATQEATIGITGMMCNNCENSVMGTFKKMPGVVEVSANETEGVAKVKFDPTKITVEKMIATFKETANKRFAALKPGEKPEVPKFTYSDKPETLTGHLVIKDEGGPEVVCRINTHRAGEPKERAINVIATGALAKEIQELYKKGLPGIKLTGMVSEAGIKVDKIGN